MRYQTSMIKTIRNEEKRSEKLRIKLLIVTVSTFGILTLSVFWAALQVFGMNSVLKQEQEDVRRLEAEYSRYRATTTPIDKEDLEQLYRLFRSHVLWTRKLASLSLHLPDNYWITKFAYDGSALKVEGYGQLLSSQDQLITINKYLNDLRADTTFSDIFKSLYLNGTSRTEGDRISFDFSAEGKK